MLTIRDNPNCLLGQSTHRMVMCYDEGIGFRYVPNLRARIPFEGAGYTIRTNSDGFRCDREFTSPKGDRPRVVVFGDSMSAGDGVSNADRYGDLLEELLGAEVLNLAISSSGTDQQLLLCREWARRLEPDLIILAGSSENLERNKQSHRPSIDRTSGEPVLIPKPYFTLSGSKIDLHHVPTPRERIRSSTSTPTGLGRASQQFKNVLGASWWQRVRPLVAGTRNQIYGLLGRSAPELYHDFKSPRSPGWRLMRRLIEEFVAEAPCPVILAPFPVEGDWEADAVPCYEQRFVELASPDVHFLPVWTRLRELSFERREMLHFRGDYHFSAAGHQVMAGWLAEFIRERDLLPPAVSSTPNRALATPAPSTTTTILGISCFYHDSAACIVEDGRVVAAVAEERFTRRKNDRSYPFYAINYCLEEAGIEPDELTAVVYYDSTALTLERMFHTQIATGEAGREAWMSSLPAWIQHKLHLPRVIRENLGYSGLILHDEHHRSHAASAFYPSPFDEAAILTVDGVGEWATASIAHGRGREITMLEEMRFPDSLGLLYSAFTQFTGFRVNSGEYKMMGLAPYGEPRYVDAILEHLVEIEENGALRLNMDYFGFLEGTTMTADGFAELFDGPARRPEDRITRREMDLARSVQVVTEEVVLRMARHAHERTDSERLCLAGGVALNCVANGRILREGPFKEIWIQPAAGDAGCALGAALNVYHGYLGKERHLDPEQPMQRGSYWGPGFTDDEIQSYLDTHGAVYEKLSAGDRAPQVAELLDSGNVVGHFSGRVEFGPRALGARSILGDPRDEDMQVKLNLKIKYRESFRPFAPTVLEDRAAEYFELDARSPYMQIVAPVQESRRREQESRDTEEVLEVVQRVRSDVPAITHIDYSARVQTLSQDDHPEYHAVVSAFAERTGCPLVVNTSFNVRGEPIVCTPHDAYRCFVRTEMDALVLGSFLLLKPTQPSWNEPENANASEASPVASAEIDAALSALFDEFHSATADLRESGAVRKRGVGAAQWVPCNSNKTSRASFEFPVSWLASRPEPRELAQEICARWHYSEYSASLEPVLAGLIALGLECSLTEVQESIPESVYVMF